MPKHQPEDHTLKCKPARKQNHKFKIHKTKLQHFHTQTKKTSNQLLHILCHLIWKQAGINHLNLLKKTNQFRKSNKEPITILTDNNTVYVDKPIIHEKLTTRTNLNKLGYGA